MISKLSFLLFSPLLAGFILTGCIPLPISGKVNVVRVHGTVVNSINKTVVPDVLVSVQRTCGDHMGGTHTETETFSDTTDESGRFQIVTPGDESEWYNFPLLGIPITGEHTWSSSVVAELTRDGFRTKILEDQKSGWRSSIRERDFCTGEYDFGIIEIEPY